MSRYETEKSRKNFIRMRADSFNQAPKIKARLVSALIVKIFVVLLIPPNEAMFGCLPPNMFKATKSGPISGNVPQYQAQYPLSPMIPNERNNWYQQSIPHSIGAPYPQQAPYSYTYQPPTSLMKMLFQSKWKPGPFKTGWGMGWKSGPNTNFLRPGFGYAMQPTQFRPGPFVEIPLPGQPDASTSQIFGSYPQNQYEQQRQPSYSYPAPLVDSWSQPSPTNSQYESIQQNPLVIPSNDATLTRPMRDQGLYAPQADSYSSATKSGGVSSFRPVSIYNNSTMTATRNPFSLYESYNSHVSDALRNSANQSLLGYNYPEWYSGVAESPAKIAQQLLKQGTKRQQAFRSANLIQDSSNSKPLANRHAGSHRAQLTILDEPKFVGFGTVDVFSNKEARLSCSFNEAIDQANRPIWVKFLGPYNSSQIEDGKMIPPFNCVDSQCRTQEIESTKDYRYKFDNGPATSTLIIADPRLTDYGTYRCSALTKALNNNPIETIYQVVHFRNV